MLALMSYSQSGKWMKNQSYSTAITRVTARLNTNPNDNSAKQTLRKVYPQALMFFQNELDRLLAGNDSFKWTRILSVMQETNDLSNDILYNTAAARVICEPKVYTTEIQDARKNAADELYAAANSCLKLNSKEQSRNAFRLFLQVSAINPVFPGINEKLNEARSNATFNVLINAVTLDFNTLDVSTKKIDKEIFYWTQREVSRHPFVRFYTFTDADRLNIDPDYIVSLVVQDYRVDRLAMARPGGVQSGSTSSNLVANGNLLLGINAVSSGKQVYKKRILCRFDSETKSTVRVNTVDLQRVLDPDIQTFFDYMLLSNFDRITNEIDTYFSTLEVQ